MDFGQPLRRESRCFQEFPQGDYDKRPYNVTNGRPPPVATDRPFTGSTRPAMQAGYVPAGAALTFDVTLNR